MIMIKKFFLLILMSSLLINSTYADFFNTEEKRNGNSYIKMKDDISNFLRTNNWASYSTDYLVDAPVNWVWRHFWGKNICFTSSPENTARSTEWILYVKLVKNWFAWFNESQWESSMRVWAWRQTIKWSNVWKWDFRVEMRATGKYDVFDNHAKIYNCD